MSSLTIVEKKTLVTLFNMDSGCVLDFSNKSFAEFFHEVADINIYSDKYAEEGDSKAKRLRSFWKIESDSLVAIILTQLLKVLEFNLSKNDEKINSTMHNNVKEIISRLSRKIVSHETSEQEFLSQEYSISIEKILSNPALISILNSRLNEAMLCVKIAPLSCIFQCGSILEGLLLDVASQKPKDFNTAYSAPKDKNNKVKPFHEWSLAVFIDVAYEIDILKLDVKRFSHYLRDFRNYIHPYEQLASKFNPDEHTAKICFQVLKAAIADLSGDRK